MPLRNHNRTFAFWYSAAFCWGLAAWLGFGATAWLAAGEFKSGKVWPEPKTVTPGEPGGSAFRCHRSI